MKHFINGCIPLTLVCLAMWLAIGMIAGVDVMFRTDALISIWLSWATFAPLNGLSCIVSKG